MLKPAALIAGLAALPFAMFVTPVTAAEEAAVIGASEVIFGPADPAHPEAGEVAVLSGDPSKPGSFVARLRFKAGTVVRTHKHSKPEYVTVHSGKALMTFGEKSDKSKAVKLAAGSFLYLPGGQYHTLWIEEDAVAELFSVGPFDETFAETQ